MKKRFVLAMAAALAVAGVPASALARAHHHVKKAHRVSGVVTAIDPLTRTLTLHVKHAKLHAASAGGLTISFGSASINGPDGAIVDGDSVTVTLATGSTASSIDVVGQPNGGTSGQGAAIPGVVHSVDATDNELTLGVSSGDGTTDITVSVTAATVLAIRNDTALPSIDSIGAGDKVIVFTDDITADPVVAIAVLDLGQPATPSPGTPSGSTGSTGSTGSSGSTGSTEPSLSVLSGTVKTVGSDSFTVKSDNDGAFPEQTLTVEVSASSVIAGRNSSGDTVTGIGGLESGDQIELYYVTTTTQPLVAYRVADDGALVSSTDPSTPPPTSDGPQRFGGTVTAVRGDGLTVLVSSDGALAGQSVIVSVSATTSFATPHGTGTGTSNLAYVAIGDPVEIHTDSETTSPVVAVGVVDDSAATGSDS